jgi:hypothetical protein
MYFSFIFYSSSFALAQSFQADQSKTAWDSGYEHTAYFLEYLETRFGPGTVRAINARLQRHRYRGEDFWRKLLGKTVEELWSDYVDAVKNGEGKGMRIVRKPRTDEPWGENSPC